MQNCGNKIIHTFIQYLAQKLVLQQMSCMPISKDDILYIYIYTKKKNQIYAVGQMMLFRYSSGMDTHDQLISIIFPNTTKVSLGIWIKIIIIINLYLHTITVAVVTMY